MKYYAKIFKVRDINGAAGYPRDYPGILMVTDEQKKQITRSFLQANLYGLNSSLRKICATGICSEGYFMNDLIEELEFLPEVEARDYHLLKTIPHWDPVNDLIDFLEEYTHKIEEINKLNGSEKYQKNFWTDVADELEKKFGSELR